MHHTVFRRMMLADLYCKTGIQICGLPLALKKPFLLGIKSMLSLRLPLWSESTCLLDSLCNGFACLRGCTCHLDKAGSLFVPDLCCRSLASKEDKTRCCFPALANLFQFVNKQTRQHMYKNTLRRDEYVPGKQGSQEEFRPDALEKVPAWQKEQ